MQCDGEFQIAIGFRGSGPGQFQYSRGLALSADGLLLLVADSGNARVAVLLASDGAWVRALTGPAGTLRCPVCVAVVPSTGQVVVGDIDLHMVIVFNSVTSDTVVSRLGTGKVSFHCSASDLFILCLFLN